MNSRGFPHWRGWFAGALLVPVVAMAAAPGERPAELRWGIGWQGSQGNLDGEATDARFYGRLTLQADDDGGLLVTESYADTVRRIDAQGRVVTLAGKSGERMRRDGDRDRARLAWPQQVARLADGRLVLAEDYSPGLRLIGRDGDVRTLSLHRVGEVGDAEDASAPLRSPKGMAVDAQGRIWVADAGDYQGNQTRIVHLDGSVHEWLPGNDLALRAIARARDGDLWAITENAVLRLHDDGYELVARYEVPEWQPPAEYLVLPPEPGPVTALIGQVPFLGREPLPPQPKRPEHLQPADFQAIAVAPDGGIYVLDGGERVLRLTPGQRRWEQRLGRQAGADDYRNRRRLTSIAVRDDGQVFVAGAAEAVYTLNDEGQLRAYAGRASVHDRMPGLDDDLPPRKQVSINDRMALLPDGSLIYVDKLNHMLRHVDATGDDALWAGGHDEEGSGDGPRLQARFKYPSDLVRAVDGTVYVADSGNARVRAISPDGQVSTLAGASSEKERVDGPFTQARFWQASRLALDPARYALYVLDDSPYVGGGDARIRRLDLRTQQVSTLATHAGAIAYWMGHVFVDENPSLADRMKILSSASYSDIAVGPGGEVYALADEVVWRIDPDSGRQEVFFAIGERPRQTAYYRALSEAASSEEREALDNAVIDCDWVWCRPSAIAVDAAGNVYLGDEGNHTVLRIGADGKAGIIAGTLGLRGNRPGALPGVLNRPEALAFNAQGDLIINVAGMGTMLLRHPERAPLVVPAPSLMEAVQVTTAPIEPPLQ